MSVVVDMLRDPSEVARRCHEDDGINEIAITALISIALGAGVFGAVIGSFRGDAQIAYSALKIPLALFATLALSVPAFHGISAALGRPWPMRAIVGLTLAATARSALVMLALAPVLWLAVDAGLGYHASILAATFVYGLSGLAALGVLLRGLGDTAGKLLTATLFIAVFMAVGGQTAWILRPYLGRPSQAEVPFIRATEGGFADSVVLSARSAFGIYDEVPEAIIEDSPDWIEPSRSQYETRRSPDRAPVLSPPPLAADPAYSAPPPLRGVRRTR